MTTAPTKLPFFLIGLIAVAIASIPASASASGWDLDSQSTPLPFTISGQSESRLTTPSGWTISCTGTTGSGKYTSQTTGDIQLRFTGCLTMFGGACTTTGQANGTITTTELEFHNVYLELEPRKPGILITSNEGHFATFVCSGAIWNVSGSLMAEVTIPECSATRETASLSLESPTSGTQKWKQVETTGATYDLAVSKNGSPLETFSFDATLPVTFAEKATMTCL